MVLHRQKRAGVLPAGPQNRWTGVPERVRFRNSDPNGGTVSPSMVSVTYGASYGPLPDPVRLDYAFAGWYLTKAGRSPG